MKKIKLINFMNITTEIELSKLNVFCGNVTQLRIISKVLKYIQETYYVDDENIDLGAWKRFYQTMIKIFNKNDNWEIRYTDDDYGTIIIRQHEYNIFNWNFPKNISTKVYDYSEVVQLFNKITEIYVSDLNEDDIMMSVLRSSKQTNYDKRKTNNEIKMIPISHLTLVLPESHIDPRQMEDFTKLLGLLRNQDVTINVLTNSVYILTKLNNLMLGFDLLNNKDFRILDITRSTKYLISYNDVRCYMDFKSIKNDENRLILASELDSASTNIAEEFSKIMELV